MREIPLKPVAFGGVRNCVVNKAGQVVDTLSDRELSNLHAVNGQPPKRIADAWVNGEVCVIGGSPDYGNGTAGFMLEGEVCEYADRFEIGYLEKIREGLFRREKLNIRKADITVSREGGLTFIKITDAWDELKTGVIEINAGVMRVAE